MKEITEHYPKPDHSPVMASREGLLDGLLLTILLLVIVITFSSCKKTPAGAEISETQVWRLELEQLHDGSTSFYPRRGTITMRLRLNKTTQPDATCEGHESGLEDVTTFVADVEAFASRLQAAATGSADGSWNCHGMVATVRLNDGTRYDLRSDGPGQQVGPPNDRFWRWGREYTVNWTDGARRGQFWFRGIEPYEDFERIRESHVDVLVQNRTGDDWEIGMNFPAAVSNPLSIEYSLREGQGWRTTYEEVPAAGTANLSWPSHRARRLGDPEYSILEYYIVWVIPDGSDEWNDVEMEATCYLAPDHGDQVQLIIEDGRLECGEGWIRGPYVATARTPLFIHAGSQTVQDTVTLVTQLVDEIVVESTEPAVTASLSGPNTGPLLTVTVAPEAPRTEHGLRVIGRRGSLADTAFIPVYVYELNLTTAADTLIIAPGASDTTSLLIDGEGIFSDIRFSATDPPSGVLQSVPSFDPGVNNLTSGVASVVTVSVSSAATPGTYDLTLCATIVEDPLEICHPALLTLIVPENTPPAATIALPADGGQFATGAGIDFSGSATDPEDGTLSGSDLVWTSSLDGQIGTGTGFTRSDLSAGTHTITLTATDSDGATGSASVKVVIDPPAGGCQDFNLRLDFNPIEVAAGGSDVVPVFIERAAGFSGQVELGLFPVSGGPRWDEVMKSYWFDPNPADSSAKWSTFSFTMRDDVSVGKSYDFEIIGASPWLEVVPEEEECTIPITFEVVQ